MRILSNPKENHGLANRKHRKAFPDSKCPSEARDIKHFTLSRVEGQSPSRPHIAVGRNFPSGGSQGKVAKL